MTKSVRLMARLFGWSGAPRPPKQSRYVRLGAGQGRALQTGRRSGAACGRAGCTALQLSVASGLRRLSRRGFMVLCMNSRFDNNETLLRFETIALDVKEGVAFLRQPGRYHQGRSVRPQWRRLDHELLSGRGREWPSYCQGAGKLTQCGNELSGLRAPSGIVFADAHRASRSDHARPQSLDRR